MMSFVTRVTLLALIPRLALALLTRDLGIGLDDMFQYDMLARSLVAGNDYRWYAEEDVRFIKPYLTLQRPADYDTRGVLSSHRAPGYPAFLALVYAAAGVGPHRFFAARLAQAILGALLVPLSWALARRAGFGDRAARWAAVAIAIFPLLVVYPLALASENIFIPLLTLSVLLLLQASESGRLRDYAAAGFILGLTALTRSIISGFVVIAAAWAWRAAAHRSDGLRRCAVLILCFLLVTLPWAMRNTLLHGRPTWIESSLGYNLYLGYHPKSTGTFQFGISLDLLPIIDDAERNERGMAAFGEFVHADPGRIPLLMLSKAGYLWGLDRRALMYFYSNGFFGPWPPWLLGLVLALDAGPLILLAPAAAIGLICGKMERRKALMAVLLAYYTCIHMLTLAEPRFHVPLFPLISVLVAHALVGGAWPASTRRQRWLAGLLIAALVVNWALEIARDWDTLAALFGPEGFKLRLPY